MVEGLFAGTFRSNLDSNSCRLTDDEIWTALAIGGLDERIKALDGALDAPILADGK